MPKAPTGRDFYVATPEEIRDGRTTDVYFLRTLDILKKAGKDRTRVVAGVTAGTLPNGWPWGILCGVEEAVHLLTGRPVSLCSLPEGSLFPARTAHGIPVPVMILEGAYGDWAVYETPVLGLVCQASGIATKASRLRKLAAGKQLLSFGVRRMHPGIAPLIERSAYVAGADVDGFGVGTSLSNAPTIDFAMDIVEVEGKPAAKRGKFGGRKDLQRCPKDGTYEVGERTCAVCGSKMVAAYVRYLDNGRPSTPLPSLADIRRRTAEELSHASLEI